MKYHKLQPVKNRDGKSGVITEVISDSLVKVCYDFYTEGVDEHQVSTDELTFLSPEEQAEEYAQRECSCYTNDYYGFLAGYQAAMKMMGKHSEQQ
jgi:hypothetical protein